MRLAAKRDYVEPDIIEALEEIGISVLRLSAPGCPDLLCWHPLEGFRLLEVKHARGRLTPLQKAFGMPFSVVRSVAEALAIYGVKA